MARHATTPRVSARKRKSRSRNTRTIKVLTFVIVLFAAFIIGFALRGNSALLDSIGFPQSVTGVSEDKNDTDVSSKDPYNSLAARISEVEDILATDSLDSYDLETITGDVLTAFAAASARLATMMEW